MGHPVGKKKLGDVWIEMVGGCHGFGVFQNVWGNRFGGFVPLNIRSCDPLWHGHVLFPVKTMGPEYCMLVPTKLCRSKPGMYGYVCSLNMGSSTTQKGMMAPHYLYVTWIMNIFSIYMIWLKSWRVTVVVPSIFLKSGDFPPKSPWFSLASLQRWALPRCATRCRRHSEHGAELRAQSQAKQARGGRQRDCSWRRSRWWCPHCLVFFGMKYGELWWNMVNYGEIWWIMVKYGELWWNMVNYGEIWWIMVKYGELWWNMVNYGEIWWIMVKYGELWWNMVNYGEIWWIMVKYGELWWNMVNYGEINWYNMINIWWNRCYSFLMDKRWAD